MRPLEFKRVGNWGKRVQEDTWTNRKDLSFGIRSPEIETSQGKFAVLLSIACPSDIMKITEARFTLEPRVELTKVEFAYRFDDQPEQRPLYPAVGVTIGETELRARFLPALAKASTLWVKYSSGSFVAEATIDLKGAKDVAEQFLENCPAK